MPFPSKLESKNPYEEGFATERNGEIQDYLEEASIEFDDACSESFWKRLHL